MSNRLHRFERLFVTQAKEFYRDFGSVFFSFVFPLFFAGVLVASDLMNPTFTFEFGVVDPQANPNAHGFVEALSSNRSIEARSMSRDEALKALGNDELQAFVVLPADRLGAGGGEIELVVGPRYEEFARLVLEAVRSRLTDPAGQQAAAFDFRVAQPSVEVRSEFNFMFPGMLALALLQLGLFATATPLLRARERGTLKHLLLTPLSIAELLLCQLGVRFLVGIAQIGVLLGVGMLVTEFSVGEWLAILGVSLMGMVMLVSMGYALAGAAPNLEAGMAMIMIANFSMLFGGNVFFDMTDTAVLGTVSYLLPLSYLSDMFRQVMGASSGHLPLWLNALAMAGWSALAMAIAVRTFRFDMVPRSRGARLATA